MTRIRLEYVHEYRSRERTYYYFRRRGFKRVRLPGLPGSAEFMAAYQQALSASQPKEIGANRTRPGTVNAAVVGYYHCLAFRETAMGTATPATPHPGTLPRRPRRQEHSNAATGIHKAHA